MPNFLAGKNRLLESVIPAIGRFSKKILIINGATRKAFHWTDHQNGRVKYGKERCMFASFVM